jgi:hypothetical protein
MSIKKLFLFSRNTILIIGGNSNFEWKVLKNWVKGSSYRI